MAEKKKKKPLDACAKKVKSSVQGVAQRVRQRSGSKVSQSGSRQLGRIF